MFKNYGTMIISWVIDMVGDLFWEADIRDVNAVFETDFLRMLPGFKFKYKWESDAIGLPQVQDYLKRLTLTSFARCGDREFRSQLPELIHDVEDFFACGYLENFFNNRNIDEILDKFKNPQEGFRKVEFLPPSLLGCYGNSIEDIIQIHPNMSTHPNSPNLSSKEIRRLYMFHEMGHKLLGILKNYKIINEFTSTLPAVLRNKGVNKKIEDTQLIGHGFWMLEESLVQELAEILAYRAAAKERPAFTRRRDMGVMIETNHDFYGIFQKPTVALGRTMRGCSQGDDSQVLRKMIKKCLNKNFNLELISEYHQGDGRLYGDLAETLKYMGELKLQKYNSFGIEDEDLRFSKSDVSTILENIENITNQNVDYRDYPSNGFPTIDFSKYRNMR